MNLNRLIVASAILLAVPMNSNLFAQHDGARDAVKQINRGRFDNVESVLEKKTPFAGEAESKFVIMLRLLEQDQVEQALDVAKEAHSLGIPAERFIAGPRRQLGKLHLLPEFHAWIKELELTPLIHGPMLGNMTDSSVGIWLRTSTELSVRVEVTREGVQAIDGSASPSWSAQSKTKSESDFTTVLELSGLKPETTYEYELFVSDESMGHFQFETFPAEQKNGKFSIGFGGGAGYVPEWEYMWTTILEDFKPNAFLMMGDNVYIDDPQSEATQRYCYYRRQSRPEWRDFVANVPIFSIWDDHDFGTDDCIPGPDIDKPKWKREVREVFRQNWVNPAYGGGEENPGCWYQFSIGDVEFFMLDGRYYRDLEGGTMLGPVQKAWLFDSLKQSDATFKVICSPVPFTSGIKPGSKDPWDGYPEEREEIFSLIEDEKIEGVFLIAADRHRTDLRVTKRPNGYDLFEFESSKLTNHHTHQAVKTDGLLWGYNKKCSFGFMEFDTQADDPTVTFSCVDLDGEVHHTAELKLSQLRFKSE